jgi:hypothetical protein
MPANRGEEQPHWGQAILLVDPRIEQTSLSIEVNVQEKRGWQF